MQIFTHKMTKTKSNGVVIIKYRPQCDVYVDSFNLINGKVERKRILEYSIHKNIKMYCIQHSMFKTFWASSDHSLIVFDNSLNKYTPASPVEIIKDRHRYKLVKYHNGEIILIPAIECNIAFEPLMTEGYDLTVEDNYTFLTADGVVVQDTVALYNIQNDIGKISNLRVEYSLIDPNFKPFTLDHEFVLAIYQLTKHEKGRELISKITGVTIDKPVDKKALDTLMMTLAVNKPTNECIKIYRQLSELVIYANATLSLEDFDFPFTEEEKKLLDELDAKPTEEQVTIAQQLTEKYGKMNKNLCDIIESGSRGKWVQIQQISVAKGVTVDARNEVVGFIKSNYLKGLSQEEQLIAVHGTRKGLLDTATKTADSGYLTRQLVYALVDRQVDLSTSSCNTPHTLRVDIDSYKLANAFRLRVIKTPQGDKMITDPKTIVGQTIEVYSPLGCLNDHYCLKCCGGLTKFLNSKYIGVIAAQSIGERTTQLVLRSFHISGTAEKLDSDKAAHDMITDLKSLQQLLQHKDNMDQLQLLEILRNTFVKTYGIQHLWIEILVDSLYRDANMKPSRLYGEGSKVSLRDIPAKHWLNGLVFGWSKQRLRDGMLEGFKLEDLSPFAELVFL